MEKPVLGKRYENDGRPILRLTSLQRQRVADVNSKIESRLYKFEEVACAVCSEKRWTLLSEKDRYGLSCPVRICNCCGLVQTNPRMDQESYAKFYDSEYRELYHGFQNPMPELFAGQQHKGARIAAFIEKVKDIKKARILEVGAGAGGILHYFREKYNCDVIGLDLDRRGTSFGRENYELDLRNSFLKDQKFDRKFDVVIYSHVIEHLLDPKAEMRLLLDVLEQNGLVYVETPSVKNIRNKYRGDFLRLLQNAHTFHFTALTLENVMNSAGFELERGNEVVQSVYRRSKRTHAFKSDYESCMAFLAETEKRRVYYDLLTLPSRLRGVASTLARKTGARQIVKNILKLK